jgi:phosphatidylglycerol lysyltransferase
MAADEAAIVRQTRTPWASATVSYGYVIPRKHDCSDTEKSTTLNFSMVTESGADDVARARELVLTYGWNSVCFQILNPGFSYWFSPEGDAVVGFVRDPVRRIRVVGGAPICAEARLPAVVQTWEADSRRAGDTVCYLCAADRLWETLRSERFATSHASVALGAQPVWNPQRWPVILAAQSSLRQQIRRAANKGVCIEEWEPTRAAAAPELRRCLETWLGARRLPPLRFLAEPHTLDRLEERRVFVAVQKGNVVGFLIASPVPRRDGWLFEQVIRCADAPNGTAESLIDLAMRRVADDGAQYVTLGLVPLARRGTAAFPVQNPLWLRLVLSWARAHGRRFWNFDGLEAFKAKFHPEEWEPIFAIASQRRFTPRLLLGIARAFHPDAERISAPQAFGHILSDALSQEWQRLRSPAAGLPTTKSK